MLFVGDIHITSRYAERIIEQFRMFIDQHPGEQHIVFLGDYVYHFSYDRSALLNLYQFFLELFKQGKSVYVLAGNHDWLGNSFVFEEAQKAFSLVQNYQSGYPGKIFFITEPTHFVLEGQDVLFFPFMLNVPTLLPTSFPSWLTSLDYLKDSSHKNEQLSWAINACLAHFLEKYPNILLVHHYYFHKVSLPGYKSVFSFKDIALSGDLLDFPSLTMLSGHLHQACSYKNYLCTGSVWFTSSLESNHEKYLFIFSDGKYTAFPIRVNPYFQMEAQQNISQEYLHQRFIEQIVWVQSNFTGLLPVSFETVDTVPWEFLTLTLLSDDLDYQGLEERVSPSLFSQLGQLKLRKKMVNTDDLLEKLSLASGNNQTFGDRKQLLKDYLQQKYHTDYNEYESILQELKVL